jgi:DNA-binding LytR/AlgR family response regulator
MDVRKKLLIKKILVIDKDSKTRDRIKTLLEKNNYQVLLAYNGKEGIAISKVSKPDLILCGIVMPDINGFEILKILKKEETYLSTQFIFLTSNKQYNYYRHGMELGADDYLLKPFDDEVLVRAIKTRLNKFEQREIKKEIIKNPLRHNLNSKIFFHVSKQLVKVSIDKIIFINAKGQYSDVFVEGDKKFLVRKALIKWEAILPEALFIRIHRSTMINVNYIRKIARVRNNYYELYLENIEKPFNVSRRFYKNLKNYNLTS